MANFTDKENTPSWGKESQPLSQNQTDNGMITGMFPDRESAESAYHSYLDQGYNPDDINIMMSEDSRKKYFDSELVDKQEETKAVKGMGVGGAVGATLGALLGGIAALGTNFVIPGLGLVIWGPLAAGLAGAGAGSISGGLVGALVGWGIPEEQAKEYEKGIQKGGILMGVNRRPGTDYSALESDWKKHSNWDLH